MDRPIEIHLTKKEIAALADAGRFMLATQYQYAHVPAIMQMMTGLATAVPTLTRAALRVDPYENWIEEADGTCSPPVGEDTDR